MQAGWEDNFSEQVEAGPIVPVSLLSPDGEPCVVLLVDHPDGQSPPIEIPYAPEDAQFLAQDINEAATWAIADQALWDALDEWSNDLGLKTNSEPPVTLAQRAEVLTRFRIKRLQITHPEIGVEMDGQGGLDEEDLDEEELDG